MPAMPQPSAQIIPFPLRNRRLATGAMGGANVSGARSGDLAPRIDPDCWYHEEAIASAIAAKIEGKVI